MSEKDYHDDMAELRKAIGSINVSLSQLAAAEASHFLRTTNLETTTYGSNGDGLKDRVTVLETVAKAKTQLYATLIAALAAVSALAGVIVMMVQR